MSDSMRLHELQHTRLLCPPLFPRIYSNSCPLSHWCYLTISSCATLLSFCLQSFPSWGLFQWAYTGNTTKCYSTFKKEENLAICHSMDKYRRHKAMWNKTGTKRQTLHYSIHESESEVAQSCPTLCDPMDCSLSGASVHGIFQARVLEWIAISFSRGSSQPRNRTLVSRIAVRRFTIRANTWTQIMSNF